MVPCSRVARAEEHRAHTAARGGARRSDARQGERLLVRMICDDDKPEDNTVISSKEFGSESIVGRCVFSERAGRIRRARGDDAVDFGFLRPARARQFEMRSAL